MNNKVRGLNLIKTLKLNNNCDKKVKRINISYRVKLRKRMVCKKVDGVKRKIFKGGILRVTGVKELKNNSNKNSGKKLSSKRKKEIEESDYEEEENIYDFKSQLEKSEESNKRKGSV